MVTAAGGGGREEVWVDYCCVVRREIGLMEMAI